MSRASPLHAPDSPYFTIVVLPDSQLYVEDGNDVFEEQTQWIAEHRDDENIEFVVHTGDVINDPTSEQVDRADRAFEHLDAADIPYLIAIGNHDYDEPSPRDASTFGEAFPKLRMANAIRMGDAFDDRAHNAFVTIESGGERYLILVLELYPREAVVDWARDVLQSHPNHTVILATHGYLYKDGTPIGEENSWSKESYSVEGHNGDELRAALLDRSQHPFLVFSGHVLCEGSVWSNGTTDYGTPIHAALTNYQTRDDGGGGYLRLIRVYPEEGTFLLESFSPLEGAFHEDPDHHRRIEIDPTGS